MISTLPSWVFDGSPVASSDPTREVGRIFEPRPRAIVAMVVERGPVCDNSIRAHSGGLSVAEGRRPPDQLTFQFAKKDHDIVDDNAGPNA